MCNARSAVEYLTYKIEALPAKLQKEILIGYLKMLGTTQKEKEYESIVKVKSEDKGRAKRRRGVGMLDLDTTRQKAAATRTEHDKHGTIKNSVLTILYWRRLQLQHTSKVSRWLMEEMTSMKRLRRSCHVWTRRSCGWRRRITESGYQRKI